jgi:Delta7-sterol 5-desaturase
MMMDLTWYKLFSVLIFRYLFFALPAFLIFYVAFRQKFVRKRIQAAFPKNSDYYREFAYSVITTAIFTLIGVVLFNDPVKSYTLIYNNISDNGWWYFGFSILAQIILHDTYFYWTHRFMHHPKVFKYFHRVHHQSTNPSPWAAFAFHPLEAFVEAGILILLVFILPLHPLAIMLFLIFMTGYNVYGHLGYELYPSWTNKSLLKWMNTSTNHNMHHKLFKKNYGLYFRYWDELMGTTHEKYEETFDKVTTIK